MHKRSHFHSLYDSRNNYVIISLIFWNVQNWTIISTIVHYIIIIIMNGLV